MDIANNIIIKKGNRILMSVVIYTSSWTWKEAKNHYLSLFRYVDQTVESKVITVDDWNLRKTYKKANYYFSSLVVSKEFRKMHANNLKKKCPLFCQENYAAKYQIICD